MAAWEPYSQDLRQRVFAAADDGEPVGQISNGVIEGINSLLQASKAKACGYQPTRNLKAMIYLIAGKLNMQLPALA